MNISKDNVLNHNRVNMHERQKVKESYLLSTYDPMTEVSAQKVQEYHEKIMEESKELFTASNIKHPKDKLSVYDFLYEDEGIGLLSAHLTDTNKSITPEMHNSLGKSLASLYLRCKRVRLKFYIVYRLLHQANARNYVLNQRFNLILNTMQRKAIHIDFKCPPENGPSITLATTIALLGRQLKESESSLKQLLLGLMKSYKLSEKDPLNVSAISDALTEIAPPGFKGKEADYYYIIRLILMGSITPMFDQIQQKQWNTYLDELMLILGFCSNTKVLDFSSLINNDHTINIPIEEFLCSNKCSNNTFSRLINAFNKLMPLFWVICAENLLRNESNIK